MKYKREYDNIAVLFEKTVQYRRIFTYAQIAQLVEQRTENPRVAGSIPALGIFIANNLIYYYGALAQLVEHLTFNQVVRGSNPRCFTIARWLKPSVYKGFGHFFVVLLPFNDCQ